MRFQIHCSLFVGLFCLVLAVKAAEEIPTVRFTVSSFVVTGQNPLPDTETQRLLEPFLGEHEGLDGLVEAAAELESRILAAGHSFHRVILPPQTIEQGRINMEVVVFKIANLEVTGNQYFSTDNIKGSLPGLQPGKVPDTRALSRELAVANDHPSKQVTIRIKSSEVPNSIDAVLDVQDQRPWQLFTGLNNIGNDETGGYRFSTGVQHSNITGHDDAFTFSYTTSPGHFSDVKQIGANYQIPVYALSGNLYLFYSTSDVDSGKVEQVFDVSGAGRFLGGRYTHTFLNIDTYRHHASMGIEDKLFENDITFQGTPLGTDVRSRPFSLIYSGEFRFERSSLDYDLGYTRNLGSGSKNSDQVYAQARRGADASWQVFRVSARGNYLMPNNWLFQGNIAAQFTGEPLISGEQFGLGGSESIRGFEERAVSGDQGVSGTIEAITPPLKYDLNLFGFLDAGYIHLHDALPGEQDSEMLLSIGAGLRWSWQEQLNFDFSYGHEINGTNIADAGGSKIHFMLFYRY